MFYNRVKFKKEALADFKGNWKSVSLVGLCFYVPLLVFFGLYLFFCFSMNSEIQDRKDTVVILKFFLRLFSFCILGYAVFSMLQLAMCRWSNLLLKEGNASYKNFIRGITPKAIPAFFWLMLWSFLWFMLLYVAIIPFAALGGLSISKDIVPYWLILVLFFCFGILYCFLYLLILAKMTSYQMMFYALADKKDLGVLDSLDVAVKVTKGFRTNLFVTNLSFFGWELLCIVTLGIACIWVLPYYNQVMTRAWQFMLKEKAALLAGEEKKDGIEEKKESAAALPADSAASSSAGDSASAEADSSKDEPLA